MCNRPDPVLTPLAVASGVSSVAAQQQRCTRFEKESDNGTLSKSDARLATFPLCFFDRIPYELCVFRPNCIPEDVGTVSLFLTA